MLNFASLFLKMSILCIRLASCKHTKIINQMRIPFRQYCNIFCPLPYKLRMPKQVTSSITFFRACGIVESGPLISMCAIWGYIKRAGSSGIYLYELKPPQNTPVFDIHGVSFPRYEIKVATAKTNLKRKRQI